MVVSIHHKNCTIDIIKKLRNVPIKKNIIIRAVLTVKVTDNAASVVTRVPMLPIIKFFPYAQVHFFSADELLKLEIGIRKSNAIRDKTDNPNAIHNAIITFEIKLKLKSTEMPIPTIILTIIDVTLLQEFCLHIFIILSFKLGWYLLTLYAQNKFLLM